MPAFSTDHNHICEIVTEGSEKEDMRKKSKQILAWAMLLLLITTTLAVVSDSARCIIIGLFLIGVFIVIAFRCDDRYLIQMEFRVLAHTYTSNIDIPTGLTLLDANGEQIHFNNYSGKLPAVGDKVKIAVPCEYMVDKNINGVKFVSHVMEWKNSDE